MRRLHIDDRVEGAWLERQIFRIALNEIQSVHRVTLFAKSYSSGIQIQRGVTFRLQRAREIARPAAMTTAHFEHVFPAQIQLRGDMMIELDAGAIGPVARRERDAHGRIFLVGVVEKQNFLAAQPPREERIPQLPDGLAYPADGEQMINDRHAKLFHADDFGGLMFPAE